MCGRGKSCVSVEDIGVMRQISRSSIERNGCVNKLQSVEAGCEGCGGGHETGVWRVGERVGGGASWQ